MTGLEALEIMKINNNYRIRLIEKELKAFNLIRKHLAIYQSGDKYLMICSSCEITKKQYEMIKELLNK